ncbi:MAG TPA: SPOR domain-containing protein, partial [Bacteroidia bacterium]|nr:SPOR domain-containing protein [Bacteroidia bacterium]
RITLNETINILQKDGKEINLAPNISAGITTNNNIPKNTFVPPVNANPITANTEPVTVIKELEQINGLLMTVQIGVYSRQVTRGQLFNLSPIYTEKLPSGLYRYTAGIYNVKEKLMTDKTKVVDLGIRDAFVSAYYNGKRVTFAEGERLKTDSVNLRMEPENPIVFPTGGTGIVAPATNNNTGGVQPTVTPFTNGVTSGPPPTAENGVKVGEEGISFKVQIGAYRNQVPADIAANFSKINTWPVENKLINALYIYTVGNFTDAKFAKQLREQLVGLGITDAFVSVYQNGKKLYGAEASGYLNR